MRYAKTYYSTNGWTGPQNFSDFGQEIASGYSMGYEEFNMVEEIKNMKLLYIPCFSNNYPDYYDEIELFYHDPLPNETKPRIYGKITQVSQIQPDEIEDIRQKLITEKFPQKVESIIRKSGTFTTDLVPLAFSAWRRNFNQNNILAPGTEPRFILNVRYETIEIYPQTRISDKVMNYAGKLYGI